MSTLRLFYAGMWDHSGLLWCGAWHVVVAASAHLCWKTFLIFFVWAAVRFSTWRYDMKDSQPSTILHFAQYILRSIYIFNKKLKNVSCEYNRLNG